MAILEGPTPVRVLLVEDSLPIRQRLSALIEESRSAKVVGEVVTASAVPAAISFLNLALPVDAVVMDIHLQGGDGFAVLTEFKRNYPNALVIVLTSFSDQEHRLRCLQLGADHFFDKATEFSRVPEVLASLGRDLEKRATSIIYMSAPSINTP